MAIYSFKIVGVHYAINPDSTSSGEETLLMHQRTAERLRQLDEERPPVVLIPEPTNPVEARAVMARTQGQRIGYVATSQLDAIHAILSANDGRPLMARIESVEARKHGWMNVTVETKVEVTAELQNRPSDAWEEWVCALPALPMLESQFALMEAEVMLEDALYTCRQDTSGYSEEMAGLIERYIRLWLDNSLHDLSNEARLTREHYMVRLKEIRMRSLVSELEKQRTAICGQKRMNLRVGKWWQALMNSAEMEQLWKIWVARNGGDLGQSMSEMDTLLRTLPNNLYAFLDDKKLFFSRLHYSHVPREKYWQIVSLMLLRERTKSREQGGCETEHPLMEEEEKLEVVIPNELQTPEAKKVLTKLQKKGILDEDLQPVKLSNTQKAVLAWELTEHLRIHKRWAVMATLWKCNPETLRKSRDKGYEKETKIKFEKFIKPIICSA